jgi:hypothetical protein
MNRFYALILLFTAVVIHPWTARAAAGDGQQSAQTKTATQLTVPPDAVANPDNTWSYTDKQGKHWTYTKTSAGVTRVPATTVPATDKELPKGAVQNPNGTWSWTDPQGKKWIFTKTPFGLSRTSAPDPAAAKPVEATAVVNLKVTDKGDTVRFERRTLMGPVVWEKKKADLNDQERRAYEAQKSDSKE